MKYAVFTVCTPAYEPPEAAKRLKKWGFDGVEWRFFNRPDRPADAPANFWGGNVCVIDPRHWEDEVPQVKKLCREAKLAMPCLAAYAKCGDPSTYEPAIEAAAALGAPLVRVGVPGYDRAVGWKKLHTQALKDYEKVVKYGSKHKVKPVIEMHMNMITPSAAAATEFCGHFKTSEVGVIYDPGNMVYEGYEDYQMGMEMLGGYLAHVHVKNSMWQVAGATRYGSVAWKASWADMLTGQVNFEAVMQALKAVGYNGWMSFEDFNPAKPVEEKLPEDLKFLKKIEKRVFK